MVKRIVDFSQSRGVFMSIQKVDRQLKGTWSSGMILVSGAGGPGFNSRSSPLDGFVFERWFCLFTHAGVGMSLSGCLFSWPQCVQDRSQGGSNARP